MKEILISTPKDYQNNELFNLENPILNRDNCLESGVELKKALGRLGYDLKTFDLGNPQDAAWILFNDLDLKNPDLSLCLKESLQEKMVLFIWEPEVVRPENYNPKYHGYFKKIFTWKDNLVDGKKYLKFFWPQPSYSKTVPDLPFCNKKFLTLIAGNKSSKYRHELYSERLQAIKYFSLHYPKEFTFYGMGWCYQPSLLDKIKELCVPSFYQCYGGTVEDKIQTLAEYKFSVCYENMSDTKGYFTEKIFDSFKAGCVPVYWGAENVTNYIPKECFIDKRAFPNYHDLALFLKSMPEKTHKKYQQNMKYFLSSKKFQPFTTAAYVKTIIEGVLGS